MNERVAIGGRRRPATAACRALIRLARPAGPLDDPLVRQG